MDVQTATALAEGLRYVGAGLAGLALAGVGIAISSIFSNLINASARNPSMQQKLFPVAILGFALTEAIGLFALLVVFLILFT